MAGINLFVADRTAPESFPANVHPYVERFHEIFGRRLRLLRYGVALMFALLLATPAIARWQEWLLFRNSQSFGTSDGQFGRDVGFYVFELPFLTFLLDWMFAAVIIVLLLTIAAHILNGGVVLVSPVPTVSTATKTHVAVAAGAARRRSRPATTGSTASNSPTRRPASCRAPPTRWCKPGCLR